MVVIKFPDEVTFAYTGKDIDKLLYKFIQEDLYPVSLWFKINSLLRHISFYFSTYVSICTFRARKVM